MFQQNEIRSNVFPTTKEMTDSSYSLMGFLDTQYQVEKLVLGVYPAETTIPS